MKGLIQIVMFLLLQTQPQPAGVIAGRVVFKDGLPVARRSVTAYSVSAPARSVGRAVTDETGRYRAEGLPAGSYYIRVAFPGGVSVSYPGVATDGEATAVTIAQGAAVNSADIVIPEFLSGVRVSGRVIFPPGQSASATTLPVILNPQGATAPIAVDGTFEFRHVLRGPSTAIAVPSPGMQPVPIAVADRDITVELKIPRLVPVTGTVTAEGGVRPALSLVLDGPAFRTTVPVQPNGTFSAQLPEGPYLVALSGGTAPAAGSAPVRPVFPAGYYLMSFGNESQNLLTGMLRISPSDSAVRLAVSLGKSSGVRVAGHIKTGADDSGTLASKKVTLISAPTNLSAEALIKEDGSFEIPKMMPGTYGVTVAFTPEVGSKEMTVVVPNRDFPGLELTVPPPVEVTGRVAVDGNGPPPRFSLSLVEGGNSTPAVDANGLPFVQQLDLMLLARGGGAHVIRVDVSALPDGGFRMTLPQGDYRVVPSVQSPAYFIRSLTHGSSRLLSEPLHVSDSERAELHIGFGARAANPWRKVSGRVSGLDSSKGPARVALQSSVTATIETPVNPDGTFEFFSVLAGTTYTARLVPTIDAAPSEGVTVADKDVEGVELVVPREREVSISASVEGNAPVPTFMLSLTLVNAPGARSSSSVSALIKSEAESVSKVKLPEDERWVSITGFPLGYTVKSMTYGSVDLLENPLKMAGLAPAAIQVTFAVDPSVPFGNVQGRIVGLDPDQRNVRLILNGAAAFATFEAPVSQTGSFSFSKIPQGTYVPTLTGDVVSGLLTPTTIVVTGRELLGFEITFPKGSARPSRPDDEPVPMGATASDLSNLNLSTSRLAANESAAVANLRTIHTALVTYSARSGRKYGTISDLISAGLLDSTFSGVKADFTFSIVTVGSQYAAVATPASAEGGRYGFYGNSDAVVRFSPLGILAPPRRGGTPVQAP